MIMKRLWELPSQEEQDALRQKLSYYAERDLLSCKKIGEMADLSPMTIAHFMQAKNKYGLTWVSYKKLVSFVERQKG